MDNKHRLEVEQTDKAKANVEEKERLVTIEKVEDKEKAKEIQGVNSSSTAYKESDQIGFSGLLVDL